METFGSFNHTCRFKFHTLSLIYSVIFRVCFVVPVSENIATTSRKNSSENIKVASAERETEWASSHLNKEIEVSTFRLNTMLHFNYHFNISRLVLNIILTVRIRIRCRNHYTKHKLETMQTNPIEKMTKPTIER